VAPEPQKPFESSMWLFVEDKTVFNLQLLLHYYAFIKHHLCLPQLFLNHNMCFICNIMQQNCVTDQNHLYVIKCVYDENSTTQWSKRYFCVNSSPYV